MDTVIDNASPVQVQGPISPLPKTAIGSAEPTEDIHNQSGDSTDSLKENNQSSQNLFLNDSTNTVKSVIASQQPLSALPTRLSGENQQQRPAAPSLHPTCNNDTSLNQSSDEESFTDCPTFNSPLVNKFLNVGGSGSSGTTGQARQSLGLDALISTMGKVAINHNDESICANTTVELTNEQSANITLDMGQVTDVEQQLVNKTVDNVECEDVEMMSIVVEEGAALVDEDFVNVALPEEGELAEPEECQIANNFPASPIVESQVEALSEVQSPKEVLNDVEEQTVPQSAQEDLNNTATSDEKMDVEETICSPVVDQINSPKEDLIVKQEQVSQPNISTDNLQSPPVVDDLKIKREVEHKSAEIKREDPTEFGTDFKLPTVLRKSLPSQPAAFVNNPFDGTPTGIVDHKQELFFSSKEFDFLLNKETANSLSTAIKDSVLLKFDPLINQPVPVAGESRTNVKRSPSGDDDGRGGLQPVIKDEEFVINSNQNSTLERLEETVQEEDSLLEVFGVVRSQGSTAAGAATGAGGGSGNDSLSGNRQTKLVDVTMSLVDVINDSNLSATTPGNLSSIHHSNNINNNNTSSLTNTSATTNLSNIQFEDLETSKTDPRYNNMSVEGQYQHQNHNNSNGEVKIRNERYDDMDRKLKDMEEREEMLLKRISEKDKQIGKMSKIVEEYERSMAELMKERAVTKDDYEKRCMDLEAERNANYQHLSSLESTFSDLHIKYERSKQLIETLKRSEETLQADKKLSSETAATQEIRYDKLKKHAMVQMEVANKRLADEAAQYTNEISRLRALLKKEEITRCSLQEQLNQKTRENEELIKVWDELKSDR